MAKLQNVTRAHLGLLLANLVWAVNYPFYKVLMPHYITPVALATFAVTVAGLLGLVSLFWGGIEKIDRNDCYKFIGAALLMKVFGMVLGMGGALLVILSGGGAVTSGEKLMGNLFVVGAIAASSFSMVWLKGLIMKYRPITVLRVYYPMAAVMLLPFGFDSMIHTDFAAMPAEALWMFFYVILIPTFGPNYLLIFSLHYVKPTISSVFFYLQPVGAAILSVALHMDHLTWERVVGALVVFAGVFFVVRSYKSTISSPMHQLDG